MNERPGLNADLACEKFKECYYLKKELIEFCRENDLQITGSKSELTERIAEFLKTGKRIRKPNIFKKNSVQGDITLDMLIEDNFVCSEKHRAFYRKQIGKSFSFNVLFQKWLKNNAGKTYQDSIDAYYQIKKEKKRKSPIDKQFEYNAYIRDFFQDNKDKNLEQAIQCWKYKKNQTGHNKYEKDDLKVLFK